MDNLYMNHDRIHMIYIMDNDSIFQNERLWEHFCEKADAFDECGFYHAPKYWRNCHNALIFYNDDNDGVLIFDTAEDKLEFMLTYG